MKPTGIQHKIKQEPEGIVGTVVRNKEDFIGKVSEIKR